jgi:hypothetical protein
MSRYGMEIAMLVGERLPVFRSRKEAEAALFRQRDEWLSRFIEVAQLSGGSFTADFTPESLKGLEGWYFELIEADAFNVRVPLSRDEFEASMGVYFGEVAVRNCVGAKWVVGEYVFKPGAFQLGVQQGLLTWSGGFANHYRIPGNKSRRKIFREYRKYFSKG